MKGPIPHVMWGPDRGDGLPEWIEFHGQPYQTPDMVEIEAWIIDSTCESLEGNTVEPDGYDPEGYPSWLLALGLV